MPSLPVIDSFRLYRPKISGSGPQRPIELDLFGQVVTAMYISNMTVSYASNEAATFKK